MIQKGGGIGTLSFVFDEDLFDEGSQLRRPFLVDGDVFFIENIQHYLFLIFFRKVWRISVSQLNNENAEGPNIDARIVCIFTSDEFRRHPTWGSDFSLPPLHLLSELTGKFEIA